MADQKLDPRIKVWADKIYESDKDKFRGLITWIKAAERTYDTIIIAEALSQFAPIANTLSGNWWGYLDKILDKVEGQHNARKAEARSEQHKTELGELAVNLLDGIRRRAEKPRSPSHKVSK